MHLIHVYMKTYSRSAESIERERERERVREREKERERDKYGTPYLFINFSKNIMKI